MNGEWKIVYEGLSKMGPNKSLHQTAGLVRTSRPLMAEAETKLHDDTEFLAILAEKDAAGQSFKSELLSIEITKE